jgi:uncharacterized protein YaaW (UPF0174 family)
MVCAASPAQLKDQRKEKFDDILEQLYKKLLERDESRDRLQLLRDKQLSTLKIGVLFIH